MLNVRLGNGRQSLDLDSNLPVGLVQKYPGREAQRDFLEREMAQVVRRHYVRQDPVKFELTSLKVQTYPPKTQPMG